MHILLGIIIIAIGALIMIKSEGMLRTFGRISFFEQKFGTSGGSRLGYQLIGAIAVFLGILIMTNMINGFLLWVLSPILRHSIVN